MAEVKTKPPTWQWAKSSFEFGVAAINPVDDLIWEIENKWRGKLRLLIPSELRQKVDRQRYLFNDAIVRGDLENLVLQCKRMENAVRAADKAASASGALDDPLVWQIAGKDGAMLSFVQTDDDVARVAASGRFDSVWSMEEVARLIEAQDAPVSAIKARYKASVVSALERVGKEEPRPPWRDDEVSDIR